METFVFLDPAILSALFLSHISHGFKTEMGVFSQIRPPPHFRFRAWSPKRLPQRTSPKCAGSRPGEKPRPYPSPAQCWAPKPPPTSVILHTISRCPQGCLEIGCRGCERKGVGAGGNIHILIAPSRPSSMCSRTVCSEFFASFLSFMFKTWQNAVQFSPQKS